MNLTNSIQKKVKRARLTLGDNVVLDEAEKQQEFLDFEKQLQKAIFSQVKEITSDERLMNELILLTFKAEVNQVIMLYLLNKFTPIGDKLKAGAIMAFMTFSANAGGQGALDQLGIESKPFLLENEEVTRYLSNRSLALAKSIDTTTKKDIARMIESGRKNLLTNAEIATLIATKYKDISENRARLIARNELANAVNAVAYETFIRNRVTKVRWVTVLDDRVCPICQPLHNEVVGIRQSFIGTSEDKHGFSSTVFEGERPPAHVNCRCYLEEVIEGFEVRDETIVWTGGV